MTRRHLMFLCGALLAAALALPIVSGCKKTAEAPSQVETPTGAKAPAEASAAKEQYVCPMHPEVVSDKPGKCPKCGMDLVLKPSETTTEKSTSAAEWYCPLHPDKRYAAGGRCEICGGELAHVPPGGVPPTEQAAPANEHAGHQGAAEVPGEAGATKTAALPIGNKTDKSGKYLCPVMGDPIAKPSEKLSVVYKGKRYYFCCADCPDKFEKDPAKYLGG